jgi:outer membrane protein assembly factor BamA
VVRFPNVSLGFSLACTIVLVTAVPAQTPHKLSAKELPPSAFKLISIKVTGSDRYKPDDIIAASGLELGQTVSEDDFKKTARSLGESGAFSDVGFSFQYSVEGTRLELQVKDANPFVPASFENFVWFSDQELLDKLHAQVPLFQGQLPVAGDIADQVSEALQAMVSLKNIPGRVDYLRVVHHEDGPIESIAYSVSAVHINIGKVEFSGVDAAELPLLESAARKLEGAEYRRSAVRALSDKSLAPIYLERGYLRAAFGDAQAKIVEDSPEGTIVNVTVPVAPGTQYKVTDLVLSGNKAFPAETLRKLIHLQMSQPANAVQLATDIDAMKTLYGSRGYMAASIAADPSMDDAASTVKYTLNLSEGDVYTMGDLDIQGLDSRTTARLQADWNLRGGDPYDTRYAKRFLEQANKEIAAMGEWKSSVYESVDQRDKTVDVTIRFDPRR